MARKLEDVSNARTMSGNLQVDSSFTKSPSFEEPPQTRTDFAAVAYVSTNLFSISRVMKTSHNNNAATKTLEDIIAPKRCQQEPATKGNSKHAKNATRQITEHTVKNTTAEVCYLCAAPTIIEEHRAQTPTQDRTRDKEILLHDVRQIAQCTNSPSSLDFLFKKRNVQNTTPKKPWISSPHIGKPIFDEKGRRGQIITNAPSRQKESEPTETTHFVKFKKENRQGENDTIDECEELILTQIIQGLAKYDTYLNNLITTNREYSPENSDEETMEDTKTNPESNSDTSKQNTHKKSRHACGRNWARRDRDGLLQLGVHLLASAHAVYVCTGVLLM